MRKSAPNGRIYEPQIENQIDSAVAPNPARSVGVEACAGNGKTSLPVSPVDLPIRIA
jgi:hypothetical protein